MASHVAGCDQSRLDRPRYEIADIFRNYGEAYRRSRPTTPDQRAVMSAIELCRTAALGGHLDVCLDCGHERPSYNSCRNRHCPKCQALAQARWLEKRRARILPVPYFHVVFTLPAQLRPVAMRNRRLVFDLLFKTVSSTLQTLARDPLRLGALLGFTAVLHTWARDLRFHPHLHCIVTGGGLSCDDQRWVAGDERYLFPVAVLSRLFRGKFLAALTAADQRGELELEPAQDIEFLRFSLASQDWNVYVKEPFAGPDQVYSYLGRYTHRVGISNNRILSVTDNLVTIATRNADTASMPPDEFIRRFLNHVLPKGFVKIRNYGLLASCNVKTKLETARLLLLPSAQTQPRKTTPPDWETLLQALTGVDPRKCPQCGSCRSRKRRIPPSLTLTPTQPRSPP